MRIRVRRAGLSDLRLQLLTEAVREIDRISPVDSTLAGLLERAHVGSSRCLLAAGLEDDRGSVRTG